MHIKMLPSVFLGSISAASLVSGLYPSSFPEQWLVIEPSVFHELKKR